VNPFPEEVYDRASVVRFVRWRVDVIGRGYHPDTPFAAYLDGDGQATFSPAEAPSLRAAERGRQKGTRPDYGVTHSK
jgi:hypothetical protein